VVLLSTGDAVRMASFEAKAQAELATQLGEAFLAVRSVGASGSSWRWDHPSVEGEYPQKIGATYHKAHI
jgi:hypothetical protein